MYKKKVYMKRRRGARRRYGRRGRGILSTFSRMSVGDVARSAWSGVKYLKTLVNAEKHKYDTTLSATVTSSPSFVQINDIVQGDADNQRTGNSLLMNSLSYRGIINAYSGATNQWLRFVIVMDRQQVGDTTPTFADIFESNSVNALLNSNTVGRFTILKDRVYTVSSQKPNISIKGTIPLKQHARFNGTSGGDIQKNGIFVFVISTDATNGPSFACNFRLNYYDN